MINAYIHRVTNIKVTDIHESQLGGSVRDIIIKLENGDQFEFTVFSSAQGLEEGRSQLMIKPWEPQEVFTGGSDAS